MGRDGAVGGVVVMENRFLSVTRGSYDGSKPEVYLPAGPAAALRLTDLESQHQVFKLYWPLASAHSFAVSKPDDKVSSTGERAPAAE